MLALDSRRHQSRRTDDAAAACDHMLKLSVCLQPIVQPDEQWRLAWKDGMLWTRLWAFLFMNWDLNVSTRCCLPTDT